MALWKLEWGNTCKINMTATLSPVSPLQVTALYEKVMKKDMRAASASIPAGTVLWTISAKATQETPDGEAEHLGKVVTTSEFVSSEYGDESLFFQHMQHRRV